MTVGSTGWRTGGTMCIMRAAAPQRHLTPWLMWSWAVAATIATTVGDAGFAGVAESVAIAAVILATAVLAARTLAELSLPHKSHLALGRRLRARVLRAGPMRHCDPDGAGRPRPRAPGAPALAI